MVEPIRLGVKTWEEMLADGERLIPVVTRLIALHVALWYKDDEDSWDKIPNHIVLDAFDLMPCEREFVVEVAGEMCGEWFPEHHLSVLVREWLADTRNHMTNNIGGYAAPSQEEALLHPISYEKFRTMLLGHARAMAEREYHNYGTADGRPWLNHMLDQIVSLGTYRLSVHELDSVAAEAVAQYNAKMDELRAMPEVAE
ncbi:MAG TPA: hypothetical protein VIL30_20275 [Ramlibacter sp.]|jgi:hypothetical protein